MYRYLRLRLAVAVLWLLAFASFLTYYFWIDPLWKLAGLTVSVRDLERRGFPSWTAAEHLSVRRGALREAAEGRDDNLTRYSLNADIVARGDVS